MAVARAVEGAEVETVAEDDTIDEATDDAASAEEEEAEKEGVDEIVEEASAGMPLMDVRVGEAKAAESTTAS